MEQIKTKICNKCGEEKLATVEFFHRRVECKYGVAPTCKICHNKRNKEWYKNNKDKDKYKEKRKEYSEKYRRENSSKIKEYNRKYRELNREKILKGQREYAKNNKEKIKDRQDKWRLSNKEKFKDYRRKWTIANIEQHRKYQRGLEKSKRDSLDDSYIKSLIKRSIDVSTQNVPQELIEAKRQTLKIKRLCRT